MTVDFTPPTIEGFDGTAPDCPGVENRDLGYCSDDTTVYLDQSDLAGPAYEDIGDFALTTAMSLPYSLAVRDQAGLSTDDSFEALHRYYRKMVSVQIDPTS